MSNQPKRGAKRDNQPYYSELGFRISQLRLLRNMTQAELAIKLNVHVSHVKKLELGLNMPRAHEIVSLKLILGVPYKTLLQTTTK